jgi:hypothetical protein
LISAWLDLFELRPSVRAAKSLALLAETARRWPASTACPMLIALSAPRGDYFNAVHSPFGCGDSPEKSGDSGQFPLDGGGL